MSIGISNFGLPRSFTPMEMPPPQQQSGGQAPTGMGLGATSLNVIAGVQGTEEISVPEEALSRDDQLGLLVNKGFQPSAVKLPPLRLQA